MGLFEATKILTEKFHNDFSALYPTVRMVMAGENYEPIAGEDFVYFNVNHTFATPMTLGVSTTTRTEFTGLIEIVFFTPSSESVGAGLRYFDAIAPSFRLQDITRDLSCLEPYSSTPHNRDFKSGLWLGTPLFCDFRYCKVFNV